ncbi:DUF2339 domain-containing protein [Candidatus Peregrinibacteria bacterium]|nr:MAG: DUF2339 domain-containing protein [Candidatus Peregrinibacteria bacterium]
MAFIIMSFFTPFLWHMGGNVSDRILAQVIEIFILGSICKRIFLSKKSIHTALMKTKTKIPNEMENREEEIMNEPLISSKEVSFFDEEKEMKPEESVDPMENREEEIMNEPLISSKEVSFFDEEKEMKPEESVDPYDFFATKEVETDIPKSKIENLKESPAKPNMLEAFFTKNVLAKVGGILLFLGVLFLLQLVYAQLGPVGKLLIGFLIGFILYAIGVFLDRKKLTKESRVLLGTGIVITYLVIFSGRYLIGDRFADAVILSEGVTFFLLLLNTVFSVVTALVYRSNILLFFSFVFAYFIPFLIGAKAQDTPYTLLGYALLLSIGGICLHALVQKKDKDFFSYLLEIASIGGSILLLMAPFQDTHEWLIKLGAMVFLSLTVIYTAFTTGKRKNLALYFLFAYLVLAFHIGVGASVLGHLFYTGTILAGYITSLLIFFGLGVAFFLITSVLSLFFLLAVPLVILLWLVGTGFMEISFVPSLLVMSTTLYLFVFLALSKKVSALLHVGFFVILGLFAFFTNILFSWHSHYSYFGEMLSFPQAVGTVLTALLFFLLASFFSTKKGLGQLYPLGTIMSIIILLPIIQSTGNLVVVSIIGIVGLLGLNMAVPLLSKALVTEKPFNAILGLIAGVLFGAGEIYVFGTEYFPGVTLGVAFLAYAILYFVLGFLMTSSLGVHFSEEEVSPENTSKKNVILSFLGVSVSLFSLAIAFVFSKHGEIASAVWLFEASILFFFSGKLKNAKIYVGGLLLMGVGLLKLSSLILIIQAKDYLSLVPLTIIAGSLFANLKFLENDRSTSRHWHDFGHLLGLGILVALLAHIIPNTQQGWFIFGIALASIPVSYLYSKIPSGQVPIVMRALLIFFFCTHILQLNLIFISLENHHWETLKVIQYVSTFLLVGTHAFLRLAKPSAGAIFTVSLPAYLFLASTFYIYNTFQENVFVITIYWGILAFSLCGYGIQKDMVKYRTIGLYIMTLTVVKILTYDIWYSLNDAVLRIVALMFVGALMIVMSILYSKKYEGNLVGELTWKNILPK